MIPTTWERSGSLKSSCHDDKFSSETAMLDRLSPTATMQTFFGAFLWAYFFSTFTIPQL